MGILFYILATLKYPYDLDQVDGNTPDQKYRNAHIYKAQIDPSKINKNLPIDFVILINTLLAKRPHDRFKNWNEIIEKVNNADCENHLKSSSLTDIILKTSNKFISENEKKNNEKKLKLEKENNFLKRIYSVYENEIYNNIDQLIKELNFRDKRPIFDIQKIESSSNAPLFGFKIMFFHKIIITGKFEILNEKNFMKRVKIPDSFDPFSKEYMYQDTPVIPKINNKKILAWGEVHNHNAFLQGFNIFFFHNENSMYCDLEYAEFTIPNSRSIRYWNHDPQKLVSDLGLTLEELKFYSDDLNSSDFLFKIENKRFNSDKLETFLNSTVSFLDNNKD